MENSKEVLEMKQALNAYGWQGKILINEKFA